MLSHVINLLFGAHTLFWVFALGWRHVTLAWYAWPLQTLMIPSGIIYGLGMLLYLLRATEKGYCSGGDVTLYLLNMAFAALTWCWATWFYDWLDLKRVLCDLGKRHQFDRRVIHRLCWRHSIRGAALERIEKLHREKSSLMGKQSELPETFSEYLKQWIERDYQLVKHETPCSEDRRFFAVLASAFLEPTH